jgi:hypothetical protein
MWAWALISLLLLNQVEVQGPCIADPPIAVLDVRVQNTKEKWNKEWEENDTFWY